MKDALSARIIGEMGTSLNETRTQTQFVNENRAHDREELKEKIDETMTMFFFCCSADFDDTEKKKIPRGNFILGRFVSSDGQKQMDHSCAWL